MRSKPMLFWDTKTVLTYMEPNFRFNLALKIPLIRTAEKSAPLIINRLELHDNRLVINRTEYRMKVWRECKADAGLDNGEVDDDSDEYGDQTSIDESIQPGDIKLVYDENRCRPNRWLGYVCPEKVYSLPCNHSIRLYVSDTMYEFPYTNMKMHHLIGRLLAIFIGNRSGEWTIRKIKLKNKVLRWPANGRKPIIRHAKIDEYSPYKLDGLQSIINTSVPLTILKTSRSKYEDRISDHQFLKNVKHLIISDGTDFFYRSNVLSIQVPFVSITTPTSLENNLKGLIKKFMRRTRPIGVCFYIRTRSKMNLNRINHRDVLKKSTDRMRLRMGSEAVVDVQYKEIDSKLWLTIKTVSKNR
ncbi:unnamed protein product [Caenorhabditis nigoni]